MKKSVYNMCRKKGRKVLHACLLRCVENDLQWKHWSPPEGKSCGHGQVGEACFLLKPLEILNPRHVLSIQKISESFKIKFYNIKKHSYLSKECLLPPITTAFCLDALSSSYNSEKRVLLGNDRVEYKHDGQHRAHSTSLSAGWKASGLFLDPGFGHP